MPGADILYLCFICRFIRCTLSADWLVEDFMRLESALFRRNLPVGCSGHNYNGKDTHFHEPIRFSVMTHLNGSGHEMLELPDRYLAIEAAANEDFKS